MTERILPFPKIGDKITVTKPQLTNLGSTTPVVRIVQNHTTMEKFWEPVDPAQKCGYIVFVKGPQPEANQFDVELYDITPTCGFARVVRT